MKKELYIISGIIRTLMLNRKLTIETGDMSAEEIDAFINAEREKWMHETEGMNKIECLFEIIKFRYELDEAKEPK